MQANNRTAHIWSNIRQSELVSRIFPSVGNTGTKLDGMVPGCYWRPWSLPKDHTKFDREIEKLIHRNQKQIPDYKHLLTEEGIICPYYAWRVHAVFAADHASRTYRDISTTRRNVIQREVDVWNNRINASNILLSIDPEYSLPSGCIYLDSNFDDDDISSALNQKISHLESLRQSVVQDRKIVKRLKDELCRIDQIIDGKSGKNAPDYWKTPFFVYISNLWKFFTKKEVPYNDDKLNDLLRACTEVISGGEYEIGTWSLTKSLREKFKASAPGYGFRLGEVGFFCLDDDFMVRRRGQAISDLFDIATGEQNCGPFVTALAAGSIMLRDYSEGHLATIMRDIVLRREMAKEDMLLDRAVLQLGWPITIGPIDLKKFLYLAVESAHRGDLAAVSVVEVAYSYEDTRKIIDQKGWPVPFAGFPREAFIADLERRDQATSGWHARSGDDKAFEVAMLLIDASHKSRHQPNAE